MMLTVVILGILATLATYGYGKWIGRARKGEAVGILAEMSAKQSVYFLEFGTYLPLREDDDMTLPSPNEAEGAFYPLNPGTAGFDSARVATSIADPTLWPNTWRLVGVRPRSRELYCTYMLNAGRAGEATPGAPALGATIIGAGTVIPWFYGLAACNLDRSDVGFPANVSVMTVSSGSQILREFNDGK
jgi:Tfp pilus assembly protein PilE